MNIAMIMQHKLQQGLQRLVRSAATAIAQPPVRHAAQPASPAALRPQPGSVSGIAARPVSGIVLPGASARAAPRRTMPLRVLHVVESGVPRAHAGRLVISGRMADVCAELDRLAAHEAALH